MLRFPFSFIKYWVIAILMLLNMAVQAQLEWAIEKYKDVDKKMIQNPYSALNIEETNKAIAILEANGYPYEQASLLFYKANHAESTHDPQTMLDNLERSRKILEGINDEQYALVKKMRLGNVWSSYSFYYSKFKFDFYRADSCLQNSLKWYKDANAPERIVEANWNTAFNYCQFGHGAKGLEFAKASEKGYYELPAAKIQDIDASSGSLDFIYGYAYYALSDSLFFAGDVDSSFVLMDSAIQRWNRIHQGEKIDIQRMAITYFNKGAAYFRIGSLHPDSLEKARFNFKEASNIFVFSSGNPDSPFGFAQVLLGAATYRQGDKKEGEKLLVNGFNLLGHPINGFLDTTLRPIKPRLYLVSALLSKISLMDAEYADATNRSEQEQLLKQIIHDVESFADLMDSLRNDYRARQSFERLSGRFGFIYASGVLAAARLYEFTGDEMLKERAFRLSERGRAYILRYNATKHIPSGTPLGKRSNDSLEMDIFPLSTVQKEALDDRTAALSFNLSTKGLTVMIITRESFQFEILPPMNEWKKELSRVIKTFENEDTRYDKESEKLYKIILAPILKKLSSDIQHLIIMPDDLLWNVNFDALVINSSNNSDFKYLIQKYATSYSYGLQTTTSFAKKYSKPKLKPSLGAYLGTFSGSGDLNDMELTFNSITDSWNNPKDIYNPAIVDTFIHRFDYHDVSFLAVHGVADEKMLPEEYFLAFGDHPSERLLMNKIYDLNCYNTRVFFMAACLTAKGKNIRGYGLTSMARAFHFGGVPTLITTGIETSDAAMAELSKIFFRKIEEHNTKNIAEVLQAAKITYLKLYKDMNKPAKVQNWASLICMGYGGISF